MEQAQEKFVKDEEILELQLELAQVIELIVHRSVSTVFSYRSLMWR